MAVVLPIADMIERLRVGKASFRLRWGQEMSGQASGTIRVKDLRPALWVADFESVSLSNPEALQVQARINVMQGSLYTFFGWNPIAQYPQMDRPFAAILGASLVTIYVLNFDNKRIRLQGLPSGYKLMEGDLLSFDYGAKPSRALHQVVEDTIAAGTGITPLFEVRPHIRPGAAIGAVVTLKRPAAEMMILPGTESIQSDGATRSTVSFQAIQVI